MSVFLIAMTVFSAISPLVLRDPQNRGTNVGQATYRLTSMAIALRCGTTLDDDSSAASNLSSPSTVLAFSSLTDLMYLGL